MPSRTIKKLIAVWVVDLVLVFLLVGINFLINRGLDWLAAAAGEVRALAIKEQNLHDLERSLVRTKEVRTELAGLYFGEEKIVDLLTRVEGVGKTARVTLSIDKIDNAASLALNVSARGSFADLYRFLLLVENLPQPLEIKELELVRLGGEGLTSPIWTAKFSILFETYLATADEN